MAKDILKEAIADAKAVREVALSNAKAALEEAFTPRLQSMLSAKLSEELNEEDEDLEENKEEVEENFIADTVEEATEEVEENFIGEESNDLDEEIDLEEILNELELEEGEDSNEDTVDEAKEEDLEEAKEEDLEEAKEEDLEEAKDDEVDEGYQERVHAQATDIQNVGYKVTNIQEDKDFDLDALLEEINNLDENEDEDVNEVKDEEQLKEYDADFMNYCKDNPYDPKCPGMQEAIKEYLIREEEGNIGEIKDELEETKKALDTVKSELNEVNLLNSKLLYVNRIFKANTLDEAQKLRVVETLDNAETIKEAKLIYETIKDTFTISKEKKTTPKKSIREGLGMASKAAGNSTAPKKAVLNESNDMVTRMQKLANITIKQ